VVEQMQITASQNPSRYPTEVYMKIGDVIPIMYGEEPRRIPAALPENPQ
jgi:hypothetical protein